MDELALLRHMQWYCSIGQKIGCSIVLRTVLGSLGVVVQLSLDGFASPFDRLPAERRICTLLEAHKLSLTTPSSQRS